MTTAQPTTISATAPDVAGLTAPGADGGSFDNIPAELRTMPRWVCWRKVMRDGRATKIPVDPHTGSNAATDDPSTWGTLAEAEGRLKKDSALAGLGFVFNGDGVMGIDLDHVIDEAGNLDTAAAAIVENLDTYAERSQSGTGLHLLCRASLPDGKGRRKEPVELYCTGRFFVMTGDRWPGTPATIEPRQAQVDALLAELFPPKQKTTPSTAARPAELGDRDLIERASTAKNGGEFSALWGGDWEGRYPSQSEADAALLGMLRFWTGGDKARAFALFEGSGLMRHKFERDDYRESTWAAIDSGDVYSPERRTMSETTAMPGDAGPLEAAKAGKPYSMTDLGNAERFAHLHREEIRWDTARRTWRFWDGKRWATDSGLRASALAAATVRSIRREAAVAPAGDGQGKDLGALLFSWAVKSESRERLAALLDVAKAQPGIAVDASAWDSNPWLFNAANGTIDLQTGTLRPHDRADLLTKLAPVGFYPGRTDPRWTGFLNDATGGDAALCEFLQRGTGYTLTGDTSEEKLFLVYGPEASGKTTFLESIRSAMGDYARTIQTDLLTKKRDSGNAGNATPELAALAGARLAAGSEMEQGREIAEALAKNLTGGESIVARHLYADTFEYKPQFKLWLALNHCPKVSADDGAIWRRILRIGFEKTVPPERRDKTLKPYLRDPSGGLPAVLAWAVEGCLLWQRDGLKVPPAVERSTAAYRQESDPLAAFFDDCLTFDNHAAWTPWADLWSAYCDHAAENGTAERYRVSPKRLQERLRGRDCAGCKRFEARGWAGVELKNDWKSGAFSIPPDGPDRPDSTLQTFSMRRKLEKVSEMVSELSELSGEPSEPVEKLPLWEATI